MKKRKRRQKRDRGGKKRSRARPSASEADELAAESGRRNDLPVHKTTRGLRQVAMQEAQRRLGNRKAHSLVTESRAQSIQLMPDADRGASRTGDLMIQRQNEAVAPETQTASANLGNVDLRYLLEYRLQITNPHGMNNSARHLIQRINRAGALAEELRGELSYLQYAEETSESDLTAVQGARAAIGRAARGRRGEYMQDKIAQYVDSSNLIREHLPRVQASQSRIRAAVANLRRVAANGRVLRAERERDAAQQDVAAVRARIARAKQIAGGLIGPVSNLLQGKWQEAGIDLAKFIGQEVVSAAVDSAYAPELAAAQADLRQAQADLENFQDESQAAELEQATEQLQAARAEGEAAQNALMRVVMAAERAHMNLYEALVGIGEGEAAAALDARATTMEAAARARRKLSEYDELVQSIESHSAALKSLNSGLADLMLSPGGEAYVPNENHRTNIYLAATHNVQELERIRQYAENERVAIGSVRGYLEAETFLQHYNQIPLTLNQAVAVR